MTYAHLSLKDTTIVLIYVGYLGKQIGAMFEIGIWI